MSQPVVPVNYVRQELPFGADALDLDETEFEALLVERIGDAVDRIEEWVGTSLTVETVERSLSRPEAADPYDLPLPQTPVQSVESVDIDSWVADGPSVDADDYVAHDTHIELEPDADRNEWPTERRSVTVVWDYGYDELPGPIKKAVVRLVRLRLWQREADALESESVFGESTSFSDPAQVEADIRRDVAQVEAPSYYDGVMVI